jgi:hypothetical protein
MQSSKQREITEDICYINVSTRISNSFSELLCYALQVSLYRLVQKLGHAKM